MAEIIPSIPKLINESPQAAGLVAKLNTQQSANKRSYTEHNYEQVALGTLSRIQNNDSILKLLPDLELCVQIYVSCILDPNGTTGGKLTLLPPKVNMLQSVRSSITETISDYIDRHYKLNDKLSTIIREALFTKGAYVEAIIPEASVDRLINRSGQYLGNNSVVNTEDYYQHIKILGDADPYKINVEEFMVKYAPISNKSTGDKRYKEEMDRFISQIRPRIRKDLNKRDVVTFNIEDIEDNIDITDDYSCLFYSKRKLDEISNNYRISNESRVDKVSKDIKSDRRNRVSYEYLDTLFRNNLGAPTSLVEFALNEDETMRNSVDRPLVLKLPVESVIPVYVTNNPEKHVGYFVLLDENGNPINLEKNNPALDVCNTTYTNTKDPKTNLINQARHGLYGAIKNVPELNNMDELYGDILDHMIKSKIRNSDLADLVDLKDSAEIYRVMLARALASKFTRLLYLPADMVMYYAFDYRNNGTGKSLLEDSLVLASMAGMLLYANVKSSIQNAVPITDIKLTVDEDDPNPLGTAEKFLSETIRANNVNFPLGMTDPMYLHDWMIRAGYRLTVESPYLPSLDVDRNVNTGVNGDVIDASKEVYDSIVGMIVKSIGMTPELIESAMKEDFAASVVAKNKLLAKRIITLQRKFTAMTTSHVRKIITNDALLRDIIRDCVKDNKQEIKKGIKAYLKISDDSLKDIELNKVSSKDLEEYLLDVFAEGIIATLPSPDGSDEDEKTKIFSSVMDRVNTIVEVLYSDKMFKDATTGIADFDAEKIKDMVTAGYARKWIIDNDLMPELVNWYKKQDDNTLKDPFFDDVRDFVGDVTKEYIKYIEKYKADLKKSGQKLVRTKEELEELAGGVSESSSDTSSDTSDTEGGDTGDEADQFDMGDEMGGDEETPQFEAEDQPEENEEAQPEQPAEGEANAGGTNTSGANAGGEAPQFEG